jgi:hypothetical protein
MDNDYDDDEDTYSPEEERCRECIYAYDFRPNPHDTNPDRQTATVNSCDVYPEETRGYWFSDCARPACGEFAKCERSTPYIKYNQLKYYKAM